MTTLITGILSALLVFPVVQDDTVRIGSAEFVRSVRAVGPGPAALAAADFDGDGRPDLAVATDGDHRVRVWRWSAPDGLSEHSVGPAGEHPADLAVGDFDGDGRRDLVVANHETDYLTLLAGDGRGRFTAAPGSPLRIDVDPHPHAVRVEDVNGGGALDLLVDHRGAEGILVLEGEGEGRFRSTGVLVEVGADPYRGMALGDLDGDGDLDLLTPNPTHVAVRLNDGGEATNFSPAAAMEAEAPFFVELGDLTGDGVLDLVVASDEGSPLVEVFAGDGAGGFAEVADSPYRLEAGGKKIAIGDFDGDGIDDAAVSSYQSPEILILRGGRESITSSRIPAGGHPWALHTADLNQDGRDDLIVGDHANGRLFLYLSVSG